MKTATKLISSAFAAALLVSTQVSAATGGLYPLDAWGHSQEGHMSAFETDTEQDALRSPGGGSVGDPWGVDIRSN